MTEIEETSYIYYKLEADLREMDIFSQRKNSLCVARRWTPEYFLWLYNMVGHDYNWWYYNYKSDIELHEFLTDSTKDYITFMHDGSPSGMAIIKYNKGEYCNLEYFGLLPHAIGKGVGRQFLEECMRHAALRAETVWLYTTSFDHPAALPTYKSAGFQIMERKVVSEYIPQLC